MIELLENLIAALREELQQYGEMLALLDQQQEWVLARAGEELYQTIGEIQAQANTILRVRQQRQSCQHNLAQQLPLSDSHSFNEVIPMLPSDYQPLLRSLIEENNGLLVRVQQRARQNHLLLSRSLELMQQYLNPLMPVRQDQVYDENGNRPAHALPGAPALYEQVG